MFRPNHLFTIYGSSGAAEHRQACACHEDERYSVGVDRARRYQRQRPGPFSGMAGVAVPAHAQGERRVVVTGMGVVSCLGNTLDDVTDSLRNAKSGIKCVLF